MIEIKDADYGEFKDRLNGAVSQLKGALKKRSFAGVWNTIAVITESVQILDNKAIVSPKQGA